MGSPIGLSSIRCPPIEVFRNTFPFLVSLASPMMAAFLPNLFALNSANTLSASDGCTAMIAFPSHETCKGSIPNISEIIFTSSEIGILLAMTALGSAILRLPSGYLSDRIGRRPIIVVGLLIGFFALILISSSKDFYTLALSGLLYGFSSGSVLPASAALLSDIVPTHIRGLAMGSFNVSLQLGLAISSSIMGFVVALASYEMMFFVTSLIVLCGTLIIMFLTK